MPDKIRKCAICGFEGITRTFLKHILNEHYLKNKTEYKKKELEIKEEQWPKCDCGNDVGYDDHHEIFFKTCCRSCSSKKLKHNEETRNRIRNKVKDNWVQDRNTMMGDRSFQQTDEYRNKMGESIKRAYEEKPEYREKVSQASKERWSDPIYKEVVGGKIGDAQKREDVNIKRSESLKKTFSDPKYHDIFSKRSKEMWKDEKYRKEVVEKVRASTNTKEYKEGARKRTEDRWKDPEIRAGFIAKMSTSENIALRKKIMSELWKKDEFRLKQKNRSMKVIKSEKYSKNMSELLKKRWNNTEFRTKMINKIKLPYSKWEKKILYVIKDILPDTKGPYAIKYDGFNGIKMFFPDIYIPSLNFIIEYDGAYYHAYNKENNYSLTQITNAYNDMMKNYIYIEKGFNFCRIPEGNEDLFIMGLTKENFIDKVKECAYMLYYNEDMIINNVKCFSCLNYDDIIVNKDIVTQYKNIKRNDDEYNITYKIAWNILQRNQEIKLDLEDMQNKIINLINREPTEDLTINTILKS